MNSIQTPAPIAGSQALLHHPASAPVSAPAPASVTALRRPPCADGPADWDLDVGTPDSWRAAMQTCHDCPLFVECGALAQTLIERGMGPRAMIWAAVAYDGAGRVVENLDRHRVAAIDHKRPLRIIRNGDRPVHANPAPAAPQRHLVLGRRLRPADRAAV